MDQQYINFILGTGCAALGWFARELWTAVKMLKEDLSKLREEIARDYIRKDEFNRIADLLFAKLDDIRDKLDGKADK
jgi:hypothetical protein